MLIDFQRGFRKFKGDRKTCNSNIIKRPILLQGCVKRGEKHENNHKKTMHPKALNHSQSNL